MSCVVSKAARASRGARRAWIQIRGKGCSWRMVIASARLEGRREKAHEKQFPAGSEPGGEGDRSSPRSRFATGIGRLARGCRFPDACFHGGEIYGPSGAARRNACAMPPAFEGGLSAPRRLRRTRNQVISRSCKPDCDFGRSIPSWARSDARPRVSPQHSQVAFRLRPDAGHAAMPEGPPGSSLGRTAGHEPEQRMAAPRESRKTRRSDIPH